MAVSTHRYYPGLLSKSYEHPDDRRLLQALRATKGLKHVVKLFDTLGYELGAYAHNLTHNLRVTPRQYPKLYRLYKQVVEALDVQEAELFVEKNRNVNAYTGGSNHPFIVVSTGLLEIMSDDEVRWVLAHELGHIKSGHVLYHSLGRFITKQLKNNVQHIPKVGPVLQLIAQIGLPVALNHWYRASEYTADRAAHLVIGDISTSVSVLLKLTGGFAGGETPNVQEFLKQAEDFRLIQRSSLGRLVLVQEGILQENHPYPVVRAQEVVAWHQDERHRQIIEGHDERSKDTTSTPLARRCQQCGHDNTDSSMQCARCSATLSQQVVISGQHHQTVRGHCRACQAEHDASDMYCLACGERLLHTYFAPENPADARTEKISSSTLPGRLGQAVNEITSPGEIILFEAVGQSGEGFTCTNERLLISKAGLVAGNPMARKVHAFPYGHAKEIDHVVGKKYIRIQVTMEGYDTPDRDGTAVERQLDTLRTRGNVCHIDVSQKAVFEEFMVHLEQALRSEDPDRALAGLVIDDWLATFSE